MPVQVPSGRKQPRGWERGESAGVSHTGRSQHQTAVGYISLATVYANNPADSLKYCSDQLLTVTDRLRGEQHETDTSEVRAKHTGSLIYVLIPAPCSPPPSLSFVAAAPRGMAHIMECISRRPPRQFCILSSTQWHPHVRLAFQGTHCNSHAFFLAFLRAA